MRCFSIGAEWQAASSEHGKAAMCEAISQLHAHLVSPIMERALLDGGAAVVAAEVGG